MSGGPTRPLHILVAEDSATQAERLRALLEEDGYQVDVARNGIEGMEMVRTHPPDLIVSDVVMPELDGYGFCRGVKSHDPTRRIPFILFTDRHAPMDIIEGLLQGADNFIPKSASDDYLLERVRRIAQQLEHRRRGQLQVEILVRVGEREIPISADKQQIFELLVSTLEETARVNDQLRDAQAQLRDHALTLEARVEERTRELVRAEERYRSLMERASDGIAVVDSQGLILEVNEQLERMVARPRTSLVGRPYVDFVAPEHQEGSRRDFETLLAQGSIRIDQHLLRGADGRLISAEMSAAVVDLGGEWVVLAILRDVTERERAARELREGRALLQAILDSTPAVIAVRDREGRHLTVNRQFEELYGVTRTEVVGVPPVAFMEAAEAGAVCDSDRRVVESGTPTQEEEVVESEDGSRTYLSTRAPLCDAQGAPYAVCSVSTDVTERKRLERQLLQAQKMEALGVLAGGVAHDFNNLLGVILGYCGLLARDLGPAHPGRKRAAEIERAAGRAAELTRQLLAFGRRQILDPRVLDLNSVVSDVSRMLQRVMGEGVQLVSRLSPDLGRVRADPGQLEQVLVNLAVNARDAMPRGGTLVVESANVDLDPDYAATHAGSRSGPHVRLTISDTGHGMDSATLTRIFEPFFTTKAPGKGTGLGLASVYGIVKQSGGHVDVYSEPGYGTTFKVYLPRVEEPEEAPRPQAHPAETLPRATETILVVEDAEPLRLLVREILEDAGYAVLVAQEPEAALSLAADHDGPIHLLLTDVVMPKMSGGDLAKRLGELRPRVQVLYMSGYTAEAILHNGALPPGTLFIPKPFAADALLRKVRGALGG